MSAIIKLFDRVTLDLGSSAANTRTTDDACVISRARRRHGGALFNMRYLLISSSRTGSPAQPAGEYGTTASSPPLGHKYTININTEMNYWPALSTNLAETMDPLTALVKDLSVTGARTAKEMYGAGGWVAHHNTDIWRATAPIDGPQWGLWPTGGAWLSLALWDHTRTAATANTCELFIPAEGICPVFWILLSKSRHIDALHIAVTRQRTHPFGASLVMGPMDQQILQDLFASVTRAARELGVDPRRGEWTATRASAP
jgi:alpha-L-fucosidase 2